MSEPRAVQGYIIALMPYGNTSLIARCLTRQAGRVTLMAKGASRPKSPFTGQLDLFYHADLLYQPARTGEMHTLRETKLIEAHLGLRQSYANLLGAQYFASLIETITEPGTPIEAEYDLFAKALTYLCQTAITWRAVERYEQRILTLAGIAQTNRDLPRAFHALHHPVPALRETLLKQIGQSSSSPRD